MLVGIVIVSGGRGLTKERGLRPRGQGFALPREREREREERGYASLGKAVSRLRLESVATRSVAS